MKGSYLIISPCGPSMTKTIEAIDWLLLPACGDAEVAKLVLDADHDTNLDHCWTSVSQGDGLLWWECNSTTWWEFRLIMTQETKLKAFILKFYSLQGSYDENDPLFILSSCCWQTASVSLLGMEWDCHAQLPVTDWGDRVRLDVEWASDLTRGLWAASLWSGRFIVIVCILGCSTPGIM